jgi:peptide/nickel transport system permease protein
MPNLYRKITRYVLAFAAIITLNFFVPRLMPGDPLINMLGEDLSLSQSQIEDLRAELGLDKPLGVQYVEYWGDLATLRLGYSYHHSMPVAAVIGSRMKWTLLFILPSLCIGAAGGAVFGSLAGWKAGSTGSKIATSAFLCIYSIPPFFLALLFLYFFAFRLALFPLKGYYGTGTFLDIARHLVLPVLVLSLFTMSRNYMTMRGSVIQEKQKLYTVYARSKGIGSALVRKRHVFWNASLPLVSLIALDFGFIFSGALFVEIIFSMNGMGTLIYEAIRELDYPVLQGAFFVIAVMIIGFNIIADILYALIDPRVRKRE